jgi:hypothetical protein
MNFKIKNYCIPAFIFLLFFISVTSLAQQKDGKFRFIYNNDGTDIIQNLSVNNAPISIDEFNKYLDRIKNSGVTTLMLCAGSTMPYYRSKVERAFGDAEDPRLLKRLKEKPEDSLRSASMVKFNNTFRMLADNGTNIIKLGVDHAKEICLETFISLRMNDLHAADTTEYFPSVHGEFWSNHPEYWMGDHPGWHAGGGFNFAHKAVRDFKLALIKEQCELFNIDGYELDFMRFLEYFPFEHGREYLGVMTQWIKEIRKEINAIAKKKGTKILLAVRIPPRMELCYDKGLEVKEWVKLNLIDFITVAPHWICDPNLPVKKFKEELGNTKIPVYSTIDGGQYQPYENRSQGIMRGVAANHYFQGTDGLYLFNFWFNNRDMKQQNEYLENNSVEVSTYRNPDLLKELNSPLNLVKRNKIYSLSDGSQETSYHHETPFPIFMSAWEEYKVKLNIPEDFTVNKPEFIYLFLRGTKNSKFQVKVNGIFIDSTNADLALKYKRTANLLPEDNVFVFKISSGLIKNGENDFNLRSIQQKPFFMKRIEVLVSFGNVKQFGYF